MLHADAKTAFIDGHSDIDLYLRQIPGFVDPNKVLRLNRPLYGTKQAVVFGASFYAKLLYYGRCFYQLKSDECIFISPERRTIILILVYVDDIFIIAPQSQQCQDMYNYLAQHSRMNNLGVPTISSASISSVFRTSFHLINPVISIVCSMV